MLAKMEIPEVQILDEVASTQDAAFALAEKNHLPSWGSVLALRQLSGRGQTRRHWQSYEGNLMVSLRLPAAAPFSEQQGAVALGGLLGEALRQSGHETFLKWPNDLGRPINGHFHKFTGILLEERGDIIIAGIGVNLLHAPPRETLRADGHTPGCVLAPPPPDSPRKFWRSTLAKMREIYKSQEYFNTLWNKLANALLIWKNLPISIDGNPEISRGIEKGVAQNGALLVERENGNIVEISSGSIWHGSE